MCSVSGGDAYVLINNKKVSERGHLNSIVFLIFISQRNWKQIFFLSEALKIAKNEKHCKRFCNIWMNNYANALPHDLPEMMTKHLHKLRNCSSLVQGKTQIHVAAFTLAACSFPIKSLTTACLPNASVHSKNLTWFGAFFKDCSIYLLWCKWPGIWLHDWVNELTPPLTLRSALLPMLLFFWLHTYMVITMLLFAQPLCGMGTI